jgi:3-methyladenine DNA glycosylase AlkD
MTSRDFTDVSLPEEFDAQKLIALVTQALEGQAEDPKYKAGISRAVPGAPKTYGARVPVLRKMADHIRRQYKNQPKSLIELSESLWAQASREHRLIALFLLGGQKKLSPAERWGIGVKYLPDISDWELCDQMCHALLGAALAEDPGYMDELESWLSDENFWVRRAAIVSTILLRRAKYSEALAEGLDRRTLTMCARLLDDDEHYVRKAVDWTVREVIKRHEDLAFAWMLDQASASLSSIGRSTLKLAAKKLSKAKQARFLEALGA